MTQDLSYILNHLGEERERYFDAVIPPIVQSAIFAHPDVATMRRRLGDEIADFAQERFVAGSIGSGIDRRLKLIAPREQRAILGREASEDRGNTSPPDGCADP